MAMATAMLVDHAGIAGMIIAAGVPGGGRGDGRADLLGGVHDVAEQHGQHQRQRDGKRRPPSADANQRQAHQACAPLL